MPMAHEQKSFCRFCIALCGIKVTVDGETVTAVKGDAEHPGSRGYTCAKGRSLGRWHHHPDRILFPRRQSDARWERQSWKEAISDIATTIQRTIAANGANSVGVYSGTAASLDGAGKWAAEQFVRLLNSRSKYSAISIDNPCKPLVSLLMSGNPALVPVIDHERCTLTMFLGCNPVVSHGHVNGFPDPVVRLRELATSPRELWIIDTRKTESSRLATATLQPRPGTDFAIIAYLVHELLEHGGCDVAYLQMHTSAEDRTTLEELLKEWTLSRASEVTGCPKEGLVSLLAAVRRHGRVAVQTGTGTTMTAAANITEWLVWVLHIVTGSYDAPGGMWFHPGLLRRIDHDVQQNALLPSPTAGPPSRPELKIWGDEFPCSALVDEIEAGNLRVLVVFGGNPLSAFPDATRTLNALKKLDALVLLDVVENEMSEIASHVLPVRGQLERADIPFYYDQFNLDFSTQFTPAVVPPAGESQSMWWVAARIAEELDLPFLPQPLSSCSTDVDVLRHIAVRSNTSFDEIVSKQYVSGLPTFGWVLSTVLPNNRWRLTPQEFVNQCKQWRDLMPPGGLLLTSRRQHHKLNSQQPPTLQRSEEMIAFLHPKVASPHAINDGDEIIISSTNGSLVVRAKLSDDVHVDSISVAHGKRDANVSVLTSRLDVDNLTGMVVQTAIPVTVKKLQ